LLPLQLAEALADLVVQVHHVGHQEAQPQADRGQAPGQERAPPVAARAAIVVVVVFVVLDACHAGSAALERAPPGSGARGGERMRDRRGEPRAVAPPWRPASPLQPELSLDAPPVRRCALPARPRRGPVPPWPAEPAHARTARQLAAPPRA